MFPKHLCKQYHIDFYFFFGTEKSVWSEVNLSLMYKQLYIASTGSSLYTSVIGIYE